MNVIEQIDEHRAKLAGDYAAAVRTVADAAKPSAKDVERLSELAIRIGKDGQAVDRDVQIVRKARELERVAATETDASKAIEAAGEAERTAAKALADFDAKVEAERLPLVKEHRWTEGRVNSAYRQRDVIREAGKELAIMRARHAELLGIAEPHDEPFATGRELEQISKRNPFIGDSASTPTTTPDVPASPVYEEMIGGGRVRAEV